MATWTALVLTLIAMLNVRTTLCEQGELRTELVTRMGANWTFCVFMASRLLFNLLPTKAKKTLYNIVGLQASC